MVKYRWDHEVGNVRITFRLFKHLIQTHTHTHTHICDLWWAYEMSIKYFQRYSVAIDHCPLEYVQPSNDMPPTCSRPQWAGRISVHVTNDDRPPAQLVDVGNIVTSSACSSRGHVVRTYMHASAIFGGRHSLGLKTKRLRRRSRYPVDRSVGDGHV